MSKHFTGSFYAVQCVSHLLYKHRWRPRPRTLTQHSFFLKDSGNVLRILLPLVPIGSICLEHVKVCLCSTAPHICLSGPKSLCEDQKETEYILLMATAVWIYKERSKTFVVFDEELECVYTVWMGTDKNSAIYIPLFLTYFYSYLFHFLWILSSIGFTLALLWQSPPSSTSNTSHFCTYFSCTAVKCLCILQIFPIVVVIGVGVIIQKALCITHIT